MTESISAILQDTSRGIGILFGWFLVLAAGTTIIFALLWRSQYHEEVAKLSGRISEEE
jgi:hypothetical protein